MRDFINVASVPYDEECSGVGSENYFNMSRLECMVFAKQLGRQFGEGTEYNNIVIKSFPHDFGTYREVCVYFDDNIPESVDYAFNIESETPDKWDEEALKELQELGYKLK
jgi:hypothetical protein